MFVPSLNYRYVQGSGIHTGVTPRSIPSRKDYVGHGTTIKEHKRRKDEFGLQSKGSRKQTGAVDEYD